VTAPAVDAARLLAQQKLPGIIVVDQSGRPLAVLPGTQVLRMALPAYCTEDPTLARVVDEAAADVFASGLDGRTVGDCLRPDHRELPVVAPDATVLEIASLMARTGTPLVAVVDVHARVLGAVTLDGLLARVVVT
jgi:CBS domain-containing protein